MPILSSARPSYSRLQRPVSHYHRSYRPVRSLNRSMVSPAKWVPSDLDVNLSIGGRNAVGQGELLERFKRVIIMAVDIILLSGKYFIILFVLNLFSFFF